MNEGPDILMQLIGLFVLFGIPVLLFKLYKNSKTIIAEKDIIKETQGVSIEKKSDEVPASQISKKMVFNIRKIIVSAGFILISCVVFFPNFKLYHKGVTVYKRSFLYLPIEFCNIDYARMGMEVAYIVLLCGVLIYLFGNQKN
jgi:hypothetical protein